MLRRWWLVALLLVLAGCTSTPATTPTVAITVFAPADRKPAPELKGELLAGGTFDQTTYSGDVLVVNFWAQWCAPCVAEADDLEATYLATKDSKVEFIGINTRDERDKANAFLVGRATYPSLFDPAGKLALRFAVVPSAIPSTVIIDRQGRIAAIARQAVQRDALEPILTQLAAESP
jgi:thiol-disulfide isomerase/thioredoxin